MKRSGTPANDVGKKKDRIDRKNFSIGLEQELGDMFPALGKQDLRFKSKSCFHVIVSKRPLSYISYRKACNTNLLF